jgi:hypothetical protein
MLSTPPMAELDVRRTAAYRLFACSSDVAAEVDKTAHDHYTGRDNY